MLSKRVVLISWTIVSVFAGASLAQVKTTPPQAAPFLEIQDLFYSICDFAMSITSK